MQRVSCSILGGFVANALTSGRVELLWKSHPQGFEIFLPSRATLEGQGIDVAEF
jgi:hypothetical protein